MRKSPSAWPVSWAAENSEILPTTTQVVFESANFDGTSIRQTALALGMRTEASGKFEKHLDPMMTRLRCSGPANWWSCSSAATCWTA